ncbi:MAG TPA: hypothetical protein VGQ41_14480 [Pyrinomonadaceae bacterium]|nr:hypothetical protein [Pyrinomonadaceae bacterium]
MQTSWIFIGALVIAGLSRKDRVAVAVAFLLTLCLHGETSYQIFTLSVPYGWQTTALLLSWYSLRHLFDAEPSKSFQSRRTAWFFLAFWFSYLAIWGSVASIPFLLFLLCLEVGRAHLKNLTHWRASLLRLFTTGLIPIAAATLAERLQKINYYRHSIKHYGFDFRTRFELDVGHLGENLKAQVDNVIRLRWWPFHLLATLSALTVVCILAYALFRKRNELQGKLKAMFTDDTVILIAGTYGIALINFVLTVLVRHVRANSYEDRYLILTSLFGPISALLILYSIFNISVRRSPVRKFAQSFLLVAALILLWVKFPLKSYRPAYQGFKETALLLAQKSPNKILLGDYWGTYVLAALQPVDPLTPIPLDEQQNRMPWTRDMVRQADQVIVEYRRSRLAEAGQPPLRLSSYGTSLRLVEPRWLESAGFAFALYVRDD